MEEFSPIKFFMLDTNNKVIQCSLSELADINLIKAFMNSNNNPHNTDLNMTPREKEILNLITKGLSNPQIAEQLFISRNTVKAHVSNIFEKLNVTDRTQAAVKACKYNLC